MPFCRFCGEELKSDSKFCQKCGQSTERFVDPTGETASEFCRGDSYNVPPELGFWRTIGNCLTRNYFSFGGRASRREFWFFIFFLALYFIVLVAGSPHDESPTHYWALWGTLLLGTVALVIPWWSVTVRRFHDAGISTTWFVILVAVQILGFSIFVAEVSNTESFIETDAAAVLANSDEETSADLLEALEEIEALKLESEIENNSLKATLGCLISLAAGFAIFIITLLRTSPKFTGGATPCPPYAPYSAQGSNQDNAESPLDEM